MSPIYGLDGSFSGSLIIEVLNYKKEDNPIKTLKNNLIPGFKLDIEDFDVQAPIVNEDTPLSSSSSSSSLALNQSDGQKLLEIRIFNLPFTMSENELLQCAEDAGLEVIDIKLDINKKTNNPAGSAVLKLPATDRMNELVKEISGEYWGGRPIRVEVFLLTYCIFIVLAYIRVVFFCSFYFFKC